MEYVYAAMLIHKAGGKIDEASVKKVLEAAGAKPDEARIKALVAALDGVDIDKAIETQAVVAQAAAPAAEAAAPAAEGGDKAGGEAKKEKPKDDGKSAEEAAAGLGALFG